MDIGKDLTKRQQEIFDFIKKYSAKYGYPPTVRDIGKAVGSRPPRRCTRTSRTSRRRGCCGAIPTKPRAIEMLDRATSGVVDAVKSVVGQGGLPLVGQVAAGQPILAEENIEEYVSVPELAGGDEGEYVLRIRGESMKNAGILEGDYVVVRRQDTRRRRDRGRARGGGRDGQALLPRGGPRAPAAGERRLRADPLARGARARPGGRRAEDRGMSAALAAPRRPCARAAPTLDSLLVEAWSDVTAGTTTECPVCAGPMQPRWTPAPAWSAAAAETAAPPSSSL
jgi:repressor LexA